MLSQLRKSYERVEDSLQRLTDSIAAYNPSTSAAEELVEADEAVDKDLDQLIAHQQNHLRIQDLKQTATSLDDTIKNTIKLLADTRKDIHNIPSSLYTEEPRREVKVGDLLAYAKFISKTTVPPTFRKQDVPPITVERELTKVHMGNGLAPSSPGVAGVDKVSDSRDENVGTKSMNDEAKRWLDPLKDLPFEPWPSRDIIQSGVLGAIQKMIENGEDPANVLTAQEQAEVDRKKKEEEEKEKLAQEEIERRRMSMWDTGMRKRETLDVFNPDEL